MHCEKQGMEEELGFTITPKSSRRTPPVILIDLDFADDFADAFGLMTDQAQTTDLELVMISHGWLVLTTGSSTTTAETGRYRM